MKILVTGGAGYIGSHTIVELIQQGFKKIISIDNFSNSDPSTYTHVKQITGIEIEQFDLDLTNREATFNFFAKNKVEKVIHFAALKSVPESVDQPNLYYRNNLNSLINVMDAMNKNGVNQLIFSSSCSIYGNPEQLPVTEKSPFGYAESPYARSKQMGEDMIKDFTSTNPSFKAISLRYFNPVGAHPSALIGEGFTKRPNNLVPIITQTAAGLREELTVFGDDYPTKDGSCIRDYIHVCDIAEAHVKGMKFLSERKLDQNYQVINLGSGIGTSVLEMINAFETTNKTKINYTIGKRRKGDVASIYANNEKAEKLLGWKAKYSLAEMLSSAWKWQKNLLHQ